MELRDRIDALIDKNTYLIDIFPKTVPRKADNRYFAVEKYFQQNRSEFERKLTAIILKLYCYYDFTVITEDSAAENPQAEELLVLLKKCFGGDIGYINIIMPECDAMLSLSSGDLYMTAYNVSGELKDMLSQLACSEGLFFYEVPTDKQKEQK